MFFVHLLYMRKVFAGCAKTSGNDKTHVMRRMDYPRSTEIEWNVVCPSFVEMCEEEEVASMFARSCIIL